MCGFLPWRVGASARVQRPPPRRRRNRPARASRIPKLPVALVYLCLGMDLTWEMEIALESAARWRVDARAPPPCSLLQDKTSTFVFHGLPARVICPLSHRGEESVPSLVRLCLAACFLTVHRAQFVGTRATVVLLVDASLQQNAAGRNRRPATEPRAGDSSSPAEQSTALPTADVLPGLDRAVPALADRRRSAAAGADIKKVARVAPVSGSHLAAARGVERRFAAVRGAARAVFPGGELAARLRRARGRAE